MADERSDSRDKFSVELSSPYLSPRQREVANLLAEGMDPQRIAAKLKLSLDAARSVIKDLHKKYHVDSTTLLVVILIRSGEFPKSSDR